MSSNVKVIAEEVEKDDVPGVILYLQVLDEIGDMQTNVLGYISGEIGEQANFEANYKEFKAYFAKLRPLESGTQKDRDKMAEIEEIVNTYADRARNDVFKRYNPETEAWAFSLIKALEEETGLELEALLDRLKDSEYADALKSTDLRESLKDDLPGVRLYLELIDEAGDMLASVTSFTAGDPTKKADFNKDAASFDQYLEELRPLEQKPNEVTDLANIETMAQKIKTDATSIFNKFDPTGRAAALQAVGEMRSELFDKVEEILDVSAQEEMEDASHALQKTTELLGGLITTLLTVTLLAIIVGIAIAYFLSTSIKRRLGAVLVVANSISEGDLSCVPITNAGSDEIGDLARAMNSMTDSLNALLLEINDVSASVASSSSEILHSTQEMTGSCNEQADKASMIATAVEEMTATVLEVASQSANASTSAADSGEHANQGGSVVRETVTGIRTLSDVVNDASKTIDKLGTRSDEIGSVIQVINGIAEQTNLLALNAAIEAARAGDQGRGFAVVADEVRTLAARTSQATQEVANSIGAIQEDTKVAIASIKEGTERAELSVGLAEKAGKSLEIIVESANNLSTMIDTIATAAEEQSVTSEEIARDVTAISESSANVLDVTNQTADKASRMSSLAGQLEKVVGRFRLR